MRVALHELWGCARGPVSRLAPQTRIVVGASIFVACMIAPVESRVGVAVLAASTIGWLAACRTPLRIAGGSAAWGLALLLPYFAVVPLLATDEASGTWEQAVHVPLRIVVRGMACLLVSIATVTTLSASDLREGLLRLPVPSTVSAIVLQMVHQTAALGYETRRIAAAMAVRGASGSGLAAFRVLFSLPRVWLPRVLLRAERVACAMDVRGYCEQDLPSFGARGMDARDAVAMATGVAVLALSVVARMGRVP